MSNHVFINELRDYSNLLLIKGESEFRVKSYQKAVERISELDFIITPQNIQQLEEIEGIGKTILSKIQDIATLGHLPQKEKIAQDIPLSILELLHIPKLGPKKIRLLFEQFSVASIEQLLQLCLENKIQTIKGFTARSEEKLKADIQFYLSSKNCFILSDAIELGKNIKQYFDALFTENQIDVQTDIVGEIGRKMPVIEKIELLFGSDNTDMLLPFLNNIKEIEIIDGQIKYHWGGHICLIHLADKTDYMLKKITLNASTQWTARLPKTTKTVQTEKAYFEAINKPYISAEMREDIFIDAWNEHHFNDEAYISFEDLKGCLHNHSTWSDGKESIETMALCCRDELGLSYYGNSDHSKSAFYANGLSEESVLHQHEEINELNKKYPDFKIFKSIEADILQDGSLDYDNDILQLFDFVVASIHSGLDMKKEQATNRVIKAIENPYTSILGHATGRLLLRRQGYDLDMDKIIDACCANHVSIELNANPRRLDLDYTYIQKAINKNVMISINPDAHHSSGLKNMLYGVWMARKGGLPKTHCLNALSLNDFTAWLKQKRNSPTTRS